MKATEAVIFLGERLGAERSLRSDETDILARVINTTGLKRGKVRAWTRDEDQALRRAMRHYPRSYANDIADQLDRTPWAVRNRARKLREKAK